MKRELEERDRRALKLEYWMGFSAVLSGSVLILLASFLEMPFWLRMILSAFALLMILLVSFIAVGIEQKAGYYECACCHHRYVPSYSKVILSMHRGWARYMKCPVCGKRSWQKKVLGEE